MVPSSIADVKTRSFWVAVLAELLGTMFLVLVACGACADFMKKENQPRDQVVQIALAFGLSVATIVWVIARVSGGHINPAVTFGFLVTRKISVLRGLLYIMAQCLGSLIGAAILKSLSPSEVNDGLGNCAPQGGTTVIQTFFIEMLITFVLVWTVFATCDPARNDIKGSGPLAIGLSIAMCHLWAVPTTGSGMNPARVFGPAVVSKLIGTDHWAYWIGPLAGAALAAVLYDFVLAVNATSSKLKGFMTRDYDDTQYDNQGKRRPEHNENIQLKNTA